MLCVGVCVGYQLAYQDRVGWSNVSVSGSATKLGANTVRSGGNGTTSEVSYLNGSSVIAGQQLVLTYQYNQEYTCTSSGMSAYFGTTFEVRIGATKLGETQGPFNDFSAESCTGGCSSCFSPFKTFTAIIPTTTTADIILSFSNNARNLNIRVARIELRGNV